MSVSRCYVDCINITATYLAQHWAISIAIAKNYKCSTDVWKIGLSIRIKQVYANLFAKGIRLPLLTEKRV